MVLADTATRSLGDFGIEQAISGLLSAAKISLEIWKATSAASLQREALRLQREGQDAQKQIAMAQLAALKAQYETSGIAPISSGLGIGVAALAVGGLLLFLLVKR